MYEALVELTVTVSPAVLAEMVNSEIDGMKLCIVRQLLVCRGNTFYFYFVCYLLTASLVLRPCMEFLRFYDVK